MMLLYFIRTFAEYLFGLRQGSVVAWRSSLAPFSFRIARGREKSFGTVWAWCRIAVGVVLRNRPAPPRPTLPSLAIDDRPDHGTERLRYVELCTGHPAGFLALNDLAPTSYPQRIGLLLQLAGLYLFLSPLILFGGGRRAAIGLIPADFVRLCLLVRSLKDGPVREVTWFYGYEKGTALMTLCLIERCGVKVRVVPSPNPIRNFYTHVVASTFVFTIPFQEDEARRLRPGWSVGDTLHWPMYGTDRIRSVAGRPTAAATVGFVSSGNWLRTVIGKNQIGDDFEASEETVLAWCMTYRELRPDVQVKVFLHPLERRPEYREQALAHFGRWGFRAEDIMTDAPMGRYPELMDVGVTLYSSALFERMHAGYKGIFAQPGMPEEYFLGAINNVVARDESGFHTLLNEALLHDAESFFAAYGITDYRGGTP